VNLALGDLQLSPVTGKPVASETVPKPAQGQVPAKVEPVAKAKPQEPAPQITKKLTVDSTDMGCVLTQYKGYFLGGLPPLFTHSSMELKGVKFLVFS
jgi:hypothetical protein